MSRLHEIRARLAELKPEIETLGTAETRGADDDARLAELIGEWDTLTAEVKPLEERAAKVAAIRDHVLPEARTESSNAAPAVHLREDPFELLESRGRDLAPAARRTAVVDANLRAIDGKIDGAEHEEHFEKLLKRHAKDTDWALNLLARSRDDYESGWSKYMAGRLELATPEERAALSVGSNTNGGYLVPTHLDPTIILTNSGSSNVIRGISRVVTMTEGNVWNGVTSAGVTASWDAELTEVSDDSPTFGRVSVPMHKAQSLVQASIESFEDISGLASDVLMLFADARDRLEGAAHATGTGSGQPTGIFTALDANANVEVEVTTSATIGLVDLHNVYRSVPQRWRGRSTWLMSPLFSLAIKALGTALSASYTTDLTQGTTGTLLARPVVESDDAPSTALSGTAAANILAIGDFSNYLIADKPGSLAVEFIPHLFATANNLPDGRRGWYMHWRTGADSINDVAFRLLQNNNGA